MLLLIINVCAKNYYTRVIFMRFSFNSQITLLLNLIENHNFKAYLHGTNLINIILHNSALPCSDIISSAPPDVLMNILKQNNYTVCLCNNFIQAKKGDCTFQITAKADIEKYLENADFTVNAIAADAQGNIIYKYFALDDIKSFKIRCLKEPRQCNSPNKINKLKAIRYISQISKFSLDYSLLKYIRNNPDITGIKKSLIADELNLLLTGPNVKEALYALHSSLLLKEIFPSLHQCAGVEQHEFHTKDVYNHIVDVVGNTEAKLHLRIAALFHDVCKPECRTVDNGKIRFYGHDIKSAALCADILSSFGYEKELIAKIYLLIKYHMKKSRLSDEELLNMIYECSSANLDIDDIFALQFADNYSTLVTDRSGMHYNQSRAKELNTVRF